MKKLLAVVLAACTAFALASCNNQPESDNKGNTDGSYTSAMAFPSKRSLPLPLKRSTQTAVLTA